LEDLKNTLKYQNKTEENLHDIALGNAFSDMISKAQTSEKMGNLECMKAST
jgi:hypothetical protein